MIERASRRVHRPDVPALLARWRRVKSPLQPVEDRLEPDVDVGLVSVVPPLHDAAYAFGPPQIAWFVWIGVALRRTATVAMPVESGRLAVAGALPAK